MDELSSDRKPQTGEKPERRDQICHIRNPFDYSDRKQVEELEP